MQWTTYSPNFNSTENLWDTIGHALCKIFTILSILIELRTALQEECRLLDSAVVDYIMESIVTRYTLCMQVKSGHIPYLCRFCLFALALSTFFE